MRNFTLLVAALCLTAPTLARAQEVAQSNVWPEKVVLEECLERNESQCIGEIQAMFDRFADAALEGIRVGIRGGVECTVSLVNEGSIRFTNARVIEDTKQACIAHMLE